MIDQDKTREQLISELEESRARAAAWQECEARARRLLETVPLGVTECDAEGAITLVNPAFERMTGYSRDELLGMRVADLLPPGPQREGLREYFRHLVSEQPAPSPYRCKDVTKDGRLIDVQVDWAYKRDPEGKITGFTSVVSDITEQKRQEAALADSERRFRSLFQDASIGSLVMTPSGDFLQVNRAFCEFLGYSEEELVGTSVLAVTHPQDLELSAVAIQRAAQSGPRIQRLEKRYVHKRGHAVWGEVTSNLVCDAEGKPSYFVSQVLDITGRKRAEEALQRAHEELEQRVDERTAELAAANESLAIFRMFAESAGTGFGMADLDGRIVYANPALAALFGEATSEDVRGKSLLDCYPEAYRQRRDEEVLPAILEKGFWHAEQEVVSRGGRIVATQHSSFLIRDQQGKPLYLATLITDISERKRAEQSLRQSHDELQAVYNGTVDGLLVADVETRRFLRANASICEMLGYSETELLAMSVSDIHPPHALPGILEVFHAMAENRFREIAELPVVRRNGSIFFAQIHANRIEYSGRACLIGFFRDITERRQAQEALERERKTLQHMLRASDHERQVIAYDMHDGLAQHLAGALLQFEAFDVLKAGSPEEARDAFLTGMKLLRQGHYETRRLISGVRPPVLDESGVLAAIAHLVQEPVVQGGPQIEFRSRVRFDRLEPVQENAIYRIVQEGITNARAHSRSGKVRVSLTQRGDYLRINIRDWGIGFDPGAVPEKRFGLTGIRERVRLLGGKYRLTSSPDKGTSIHVELPILERRAEE